MNPIKNGRITTPFDEMRPLSVPVEKRNHVHGALDIGGKINTKVYAPCSGNLWGYLAQRNTVVEDKNGVNIYSRYWPKKPVIHGSQFLWANYFYDMYGGILILEETDANRNVINTHLICHTFGNQLINKIPLSNTDVKFVEERKKSRYPITAIYTGKIYVREGEHIGYVGDAGYSTGGHIHWEIHPGRKKVKYADRIRPTKYL